MAILSRDLLVVHKENIRNSPRDIYSLCGDDDSKKALIVFTGNTDFNTTIHSNNQIIDVLNLYTTHKVDIFLIRQTNIFDYYKCSVRTEQGMDLPDAEYGGLIEHVEDDLMQNYTNVAFLGMNLGGSYASLLLGHCITKVKNVIAMANITGIPGNPTENLNEFSEMAKNPESLANRGLHTIPDSMILKEHTNFYLSDNNDNIDNINTTEYMYHWNCVNPHLLNIQAKNVHYLNDIKINFYCKLQQIFA